MRILDIHGVNTQPTERYGAKNQAVLREGGLPVVVTEGRWNSSGTFVGDSLFFMNPNYREEALERVCGAIAEFLAAGPGIVLAHSMGTVLAQQAERYMRTGVPMLFIGSPLSNPMIKIGLNHVGLDRGPLDGTRPISLWNVDDPIVGGKLRVPVPGFDEREISIDGDAWGVVSREHSSLLYLSTRTARNALRQCWSKV